MKTFSSAIIFVSLCFVLFSCKHEQDLNKRKYTDGHYHDFSLHRDKTNKESLEDSTQLKEEKADGFRAKMDVPKLPDLQNLKGDSTPWHSSELLKSQYPVAAERMDTFLAKQMKGDSTWIHDTLPDAIEGAFSTQAMLGLGTIGGLITMAAPESIWFFWLPMILAPVSLIVSLIFGGIAMAKISSGQIDKKYRRAMRVWALCLLINLAIGSVVLMHYVVG